MYNCTLRACLDAPKKLFCKTKPRFQTNFPKHSKNQKKLFSKPNLSFMGQNLTLGKAIYFYFCGSKKRKVGVITHVINILTQNHPSLSSPSIFSSIKFYRMKGSARRKKNSSVAPVDAFNGGGEAVLALKEEHDRRRRGRGVRCGVQSAQVEGPSKERARLDS